MRILVAGIGNKLYGDDGFGPRVVEELTKFKLPPEVEVVDYGSSLTSVLLDLGEYDLVIFVDVVNRGGRAGELYVIRPLASNRREAEVGMLSPHEMRLEKVLALAETLGVLPREVILVGCQPGRLAEGLGMSEEVEKAVEKAVEIVLEIVRERLRARRKNLA